jgi:glycosyltransferase involved in cell wall biosynthesis
MLNEAAALHFTTVSERDLASDLGYEAPNVVIPNGIDWRAFQGQDGPIDVRGPNSPAVVLYLGRISHKKGLDLLIEAFADVQREVEGALLEIAGPDDEDLTPALRTLAWKLEIERRVRFTGMLSATKRLAAFRRASLVVLPSKTENFGTTVIEAMAAGVPVVISPEVNLAPEIERAGAGIVSDRNPASLAAAITALLTDANARVRLAEAGCAFARRYDWSAIAPSFLSFYRAVIAGANK